MKKITKQKSSLVKNYHRNLKIGLISALTFTILAFNAPIYTSTPTLKIQKNFEEDEIWNIENIYTHQEEKTPPKKDFSKQNNTSTLIVVDDLPDLIDPIDSITPIMDPDEFTLPPEKKIKDNPLPKKKIVKIADVMPEFIGGEKALFQYLKNKIDYHEYAIKNNIQGKVYVRFYVNKKGMIKEAEVVKGVHPILNKEALKVVENMPKWKPGIQNGEKVNVYMVIPINFMLE